MAIIPKTISKWVQNLKESAECVFSPTKWLGNLFKKSSGTDKKLLAESSEASAAANPDGAGTRSMLAFPR